MAFSSPAGRKFACLLRNDNKTVSGKALPGFLVRGTIENGDDYCVKPEECPADTSSSPHTISGHTAADVPLSATGPGAIAFTGTFDNTAVFAKILRASSGRSTIKTAPPPTGSAAKTQSAKKRVAAAK